MKVMKFGRNLKNVIDSIKIILGDIMNVKIFSVSDIHGNLKELEIIFNNIIKEESDSCI